MPTDPTMNTALTWEQGVAWAAAEMLRAFDCPTYAKHLLDAGVGNSDLSKCAEDDLELLREAFPERDIPRGVA